MPTKTYQPIATHTLASNTANYTFSSIPSTYTDLVLVVTGQVSSNASIAYQINSDTGSNYSTTELYADGTSRGSTRAANETQVTAASIVAQITTGNQWVSTLHFQNYSNTTAYKTILGITSAPGTILNSIVSLWRSNSAINSIKFMGYAGTSGFTTGTTFTLYGIL